MRINEKYQVLGRLYSSDGKSSSEEILVINKNSSVDGDGPSTFSSEDGNTAYVVWRPYHRHNNTCYLSRLLARLGENPIINRSSFAGISECHSIPLVRERYNTILVMHDTWKITAQETVLKKINSTLAVVSEITISRDYGTKGCDLQILESGNIAVFCVYSQPFEGIGISLYNPNLELIRKATYRDGIEEYYYPRIVECGDKMLLFIQTAKGLKYSTTDEGLVTSVPRLASGVKGDFCYLKKGIITLSTGDGEWFPVINKINTTCS
jgi:hypothetical protein